LAVKVNDLTVIYGAVPSFSVTYSGFVHNEGPGVLGGTLSFSGAGTAVGTYTISASGLSSTNYAISYQTGTLAVTYPIGVPSDNTREVHSGATLPIQLDLNNAAGANVSSAALTLHADYLVQVGDSSQTHLPVQSPGNSQPGNYFKYSGSHYQFNLKTTGLAAGTYQLFFSIAGDPIEHSVTFVVVA
jgi:hypothetical protein